MKSRLWLPLGRRPHPAPQDERQVLINELFELRTLIPNARSMELSELRDHVQKIRHQTKARAELESKLFVPTSTRPLAEVAGALREFVQWRRRKQGKPNPWPRGQKRRAGAVSGPTGVEPWSR